MSGWAVWKSPFGSHDMVGHFAVTQGPEVLQVSGKIASKYEVG